MRPIFKKASTETMISDFPDQDDISQEGWTDISKVDGGSAFISLGDGGGGCIKLQP